MQHHNYWESLLQQRYPELELRVRNLGFPGDEPYERIRSENFGDPDQHLSHSQASVVMYFFGFNESFDGDKGLAKFTRDIKKLVEVDQSQDYGKGTPQVILVSPIAFEDTGDPNLPSGTEHNARLAKYTQALATAAEETGAGFADVFTPTKALFETSEKQLTLNGAHLNDEGYAAFAPHLGHSSVWKRWADCSRSHCQIRSRRQEFSLVASLPGSQRFFDLWRPW